MKILALFIALICSVAAGSTFVTFQNGTVTSITTNSVVAGPATGPISGLNAFYFGLFAAPAGTLDPNVFSFTGAYATNRSSLAGTLMGPPVEFPSLNPVALLVRGWSANIGPNYADATNYLMNPMFNGWYGESQIAPNITPTGGGFPPTVIFGTSPGLIPGFNMNMVSAIPEPSSVALAILGAAALFFFRRRARH